MSRIPDPLIPTRRSLLKRLKDWDDHDSWEEFFNTYWRLIYRTAIRAGLSDVEAQDVVQETVIAVAKKMPRFSYDPAAGSFKQWLLRTTRWKINDQYRNRSPCDPRLAQSREVSASAEFLELAGARVDVDLQSDWDELWDQNLFDAALQRVKTLIGGKQYQLFQLYVLKNWPVRKVADALQVHPARVYLAKHRVSRLIRREMKRLETPGADA
jgi:RNA polymerase sigma factor (sigma-70 family)